MLRVIRLYSWRMKGQILICIKGGKKPSRVYKVVVLAVGTLGYSENCSEVIRRMSFPGIRILVIGVYISAAL